MPSAYITSGNFLAKKRPACYNRGMENTNGLSYLTALTYSAIDRSALARRDKRSLLASVYALLGLIDDSEFLRPSEILYRYGLCFTLPAEKAGGANGLKAGDVTEGGAVVLEKDGRKLFKFDCASPLWETLQDTFTGEAAELPEIRPAYAAVCAVVELGGAELKAMWYIFFPYFMHAVPCDRELYVRLKTELTTEAVFEAALESKYAEYVFDDAREARIEGVDPLVIDWYEPFIDYKLSPDEKGVIRVVAKYKRELALKNYEAVVRGTERLLDLFPSDGELVLLHIAARTQCLEGKPREERTAILADTLELIDTVAGTFPEKAAYLAYYRGLTVLGLGRTEEAKAQFELCLELEPDFELAAFMLNAMHKLTAE